MAHRDHEDQPEAPDLGASVQLEPAESLTGPPGSDPLDAGYVPPDRPYVLDDDAVTAEGQRTGDTLDDRLAREQPEDAEPAAEPYRSGRLTATEPAADGDEANAMAAQDVGIDGGAASAEEAAVHDVDLGIEPVDDERPVGDPAVAESLEQDAHADTALADAARDARREDAAETIDRLREADGAAAPASGRTDAGPGTGL